MIEPSTLSDILSPRIPAYKEYSYGTGLAVDNFVGQRHWLLQPCTLAPLRRFVCLPHSEPFYEGLMT
jgi:hypothetical protein